MADLDGRCFIRRGKALVPADFAADEFLEELKEGREVIISCRKARHPPHHRFFFALLRKVVENSEAWGDEEDLLDDLKFQVGHVRRTVDPFTGNQTIKAKSINFASMSEDEFRRFRDRCLYVLGQYLGIDPLTLMKETDTTQKRTK